MDVFTASLRSACSLRRGHFVNNLKRLESSSRLFFVKL
ncbi:gluconate 5-dehydrogenase [Yersinia pseudotuberculosis]|nr:gluconate 5-dehydrogenase [Yersinia pseudotuberculosis]